MIPLVVLAVLLGGAALAYEASPRVRSWTDDHLRAIQSALAAHEEVDKHLAAAETAANQAIQHAAGSMDARRIAASPPPPPPAAPSPPPSPAPSSPAPAGDAWDAAAVVPHDPSSFDPSAFAAMAEALSSAAREATAAIAARVRSAEVANKAAAQSVATAAKTAKTPAQRSATAAAADQVARRSQAIARLKALGEGQCGQHAYPGVSAAVKDRLLAKLAAEGMTVTGANPWTIDTHVHDVTLQAAWDDVSETLHLVVTAGSGGGFLCGLIWDRIDPILKGITGAA